MSMSDRDGFIWYDGKLVPWRDATTHVLTHTLHYGMGVFEGVRAYKAEKGTAIFRLQEHTDRLFNSAYIFQMKMPYDKATIMEAHREVVRANKLESCYIRPICFYGSEAMGIAARLSQHPRCRRRMAMGRLSGRRGHGKRHPRQNFQLYPPPCQHQHVPRQIGRHLYQLHPGAPGSRTDGYDEALLLDVDGLRCGRRGRKHFHRQERQTVHARPDLLPGRHHARHDHHAGQGTGHSNVIEKRITRDEVYTADEAFFTGTAAEVTPIRELDNRTIGIGSRGPITAGCSKVFFDCVNGQETSSIPIG